VERCSLCGRGSEYSENFEDHHLVPKHKGGRSKGTIRVCVDCGNQLHLLFTNNELRYHLNTLDALRAHPKVQTWVRWACRRKEFGVCARQKKRR